MRALAWALLSGLGAGAALADALNVAVAANFSAPMKLIARQFEQASGQQLALSFGATGQLYAQILHGAPFAVLLAADEETPAKLQAQGLAVPGTRFSYARGRLALWSKRPGWVDAQGAVLRSAQFERLALANPKLAPYGAAALEVLEQMGLRARLAPKIVEGANIAQVFQFVASENAELGFVALSQVYEEGRIKAGSAWVVPATLHSPLRQDAVLLKAGLDKPAALALLKYLQSPAALAGMRAYGYEQEPCPATTKPCAAEPGR